MRAEFDGDWFDTGDPATVDEDGYLRVAAVVLKAGETELTLAEVQDFLTAKGVAKPYWPERVEVLQDLPRTPGVKIQKYQLCEKFAVA